MACTFELGTPLAWSCTQGELASLAGAFATDSRSAVSGGSAAVENEGAAAPVTPAVFEVITSRSKKHACFAAFNADCKPCCGAASDAGVRGRDARRVGVAENRVVYVQPHTPATSL